MEQGRPTAHHAWCEPNYPTLAESYKVAELDATNKMREVTRLSKDEAFHARPTV